VTLEVLAKPRLYHYNIDRTGHILEQPDLSDPADPNAFDFEDERETLAYEVVAAAQMMSRLADLSMILEGDAAGISSVELNEVADRLFQWSVAIGTNLFRPVLVAELDSRRCNFVAWRQLQTRVRWADGQSG
jgi:hypothetical protein